jgi:hypothetical protein
MERNSIAKHISACRVVQHEHGKMCHITGQTNSYTGRVCKYIKRLMAFGELLKCLPGRDRGIYRYLSVVTEESHADFL